MAVANFFDRALMSAAQALRGEDPSVIRARLESQIVELAFDRTAAASQEGQAGLDLAVRLLARLYPTLRIRPVGGASKSVATGLKTLARAINPEIDLDASGKANVRLVFGETALPKGPATLYAGSDGWLAKVSTKGPQGVGSSHIPFGAGGAACLGAANVFRAVFAGALRGARLDEEAVLSLFDFGTGATAKQGPLALSVDLGNTPIVGLGAIGNGLVWALARTPGLTGAPHLVDHEQIDLTNLQRYVLATQADVGRVKVEVSRGALVAGGSPGLAPVPFVARWDDYLAGRGHPAMARVVTALDTAADRIAVQASLPGRILNAWTQTGDLGVSRHGFLGEEACLACLYLPVGQAPNEDEVIAQALGLPAERPVLLELRERLVNGQPVGESFVREAAARLKVPADGLLKFAGEPLRQFYAKAICGGQLLETKAGRPAVEAPLAFQSALAGIMLAAELVVEAGGLRSAPVATKTIVDVTRPLGRRLGVRVLKPGAESPRRCICQDRDFTAVFQAKFGAVPAEPVRSRRRARPS